MEFKRYHTRSYEYDNRRQRVRDLSTLAIETHYTEQRKAFNELLRLAALEWTALASDITLYQEDDKIYVGHSDNKDLYLHFYRQFFTVEKNGSVWLDLKDTYNARAGIECFAHYFDKDYRNSVVWPSTAS